jgi:hydrogenase-4 component B
MATAAALLTGTILFWLVCCAAVAIFGKHIRHVYPSSALCLGGVATLVAAYLGWHADLTWEAPPPIYLAVAPLSHHLDALASIFIALLAVITISVALFSPAYLEHLSKKTNPGCYWAELFLFVIGMLGVILATNCLSFLIFWEILALTSVLLIATDLSSHKSQTAAFIYLGATRISTALLMAGFLWMHSVTHSWNFADWQFSAPATVVPAFLVFIGLAIKAGIWPFHDWLPHAHPAAPSPVSALMSGVMIKVSLYALIRILVLGDLTSPWLSYLMLVLGVVSAFWGVLWALMQHDLKTLLAYHSIENVGLILVGIALALISQSLNLPVIAAVALAAAIFHCVNHGLFKSLLFLGAGTIDCRVHTRDLERLGGLSRRLPWTMFFFVIGSAAICALPPLNGFNSKWLVYQSLFGLAGNSGSLWLGALSMTIIAILGLVSGMALYCFTKAIGIAFLGRPRSQAAERAHEGTGCMLLSQGLLALCCAALGICAPGAMATIQPVCSAAFTSAASLANVYTIPMGAFALIIAVLTAAFYSLWLSDRSGRVKRYSTWECGFGDLTGRMQATATSFAENVAYTFAPLFQYHALWNITGRDRRHFPEIVSMEVTTKPLLESRIYAPSVRFVRWLGDHMLMLQAGSIHLYLSYILLTLITLMVIGVLL